jgi:hypothetical protein
MQGSDTWLHRSALTDALRGAQHGTRILSINEPTTTALMLMVLTAAFRFLHTLDLQVQRLSFIARLVACAMH